ncbi:uncharacterized protein LOC126834152 [Adelges cooleyi]|uniref:uncharacterized protein LOC126834152 n=1 Tax=Adelges cooleyi TaxID=133065 RepID=UPI0021800379|nr:uncharacterized protein LOC126834152 [Adelges cooleyi]
MENQSNMSSPRPILPSTYVTQPMSHNNAINLQTDFTSPPPPPSLNHPNYWPQPNYSGTWQQPYHIQGPATPTSTTITTCTSTTITYSPTTSSGIRSSSPRWRFNNNSRQQRPFPYGSVPRNNYPRQFPVNSSGNFFGNGAPNQSNSSSQNWQQFNQRPRYLQRQNVRMNRPRTTVQNQTNGINQESNSVTECKTRKRKVKSQQPGEPQRAQKPWNREDAEKAIAAEMELRTPKNNKQIMIRFPDHEITRQIVQSFHSDIKSVHFHTPCNPRYCYVQVQPNANIDNVAKELNETIFQHEKLRVEVKESQFEEKAFPECIDPYTLYLGNLPTNITSNAVKDEFPKATRVDIGFAKKMKYTRYAFIKFSNAEDAIQAYKEKYNLVIDSRSVVLRFRRGKGNVNPPGQVDKLPNEMNEYDARKEIKSEPKDEMYDYLQTEYESTEINISRVKSEVIDYEDNEDEDAIFECASETSGDIIIKSETRVSDNEYEDDYDYSEDERGPTYKFFPKNNMVVESYSGNGQTQTVTSIVENNDDIPHVIQDEDPRWLAVDDIQEEGGKKEESPYTFDPSLKIKLEKSDNSNTTSEIGDGQILTDGTGYNFELVGVPRMEAKADEPSEFVGGKKRKKNNSNLDNNTG